MLAGGGEGTGTAPEAAVWITDGGPSGDYRTARARRTCRSGYVVSAEDGPAIHEEINYARSGSAVRRGD